MLNHSITASIKALKSELLEEFEPSLPNAPANSSQSEFHHDDTNAARQGPCVWKRGMGGGLRQTCRSSPECPAL